MHHELARLERRFLEIENALTLPEIAAQPSEFKKLSKERSELEKIITVYREYKDIEKQLQDARAMIAEGDSDLVQMAREEIDLLEPQEKEYQQKLEVLLLPKDPHDERNIYLEVRAAAGGDEAGLFAERLMRMYCRYAERRGWRYEVQSINDTGLGGIKEVILYLMGEGIYGTLKYESGVHRVQRVPVTESQGRVHTSTVTVAVLPEADDVEVSIDEKDLRIDTFRAGGAGGQHVNRTDSAVRITHMPSGIVIVCQDERSQLKNKAKAMKILQAKLLENAEQEQAQNMSAERRALVGRGDRSERIRTYNFPQSRVTDHRINFTTHAIGDVMDGGIQELVDQLRLHAQAEALKARNDGNQTQFCS